MKSSEVKWRLKQPVGDKLLEISWSQINLKKN